MINAHAEGLAACRIDVRKVYVSVRYVVVRDIASEVQRESRVTQRPVYADYLCPLHSIELDN